MGHAMAQNLAKFLASPEASSSGTKFDPTLRVWNRDATKCADLAESHGCQQYATLEELARTCTIIHTCLVSYEVASLPSAPLCNKFITTICLQQHPGPLFPSHDP